MTDHREDRMSAATSAGVTEEQTPRVTDAMIDAGIKAMPKDAFFLIYESDMRVILEAALEASRVAPVSQKEADTFQARVQPWMMACFGPEISADRVERGDRFLEEVFELLQSGGYDPARVLPLRDYVWGREVGEPSQEAGGVQVTLAAYCLAHGLDMHAAGETELARIWTKVEKIRAKQAAKPTGSALPVAVSAAPSSAGRSSMGSAEQCSRCDGIADGVVAWLANYKYLDADGEVHLGDVIDALNGLIEEPLYASPAPAVEPVGIKALEWTGEEKCSGIGDTSTWEATAFGCSLKYAVVEWYGAGHFTLYADSQYLGTLNSLQDAKAAAQADFETRIRSALHPSPTPVSAPVGMVEEVYPAGTKRVCPKRDATCPHGMGCPYVDGYWCNEPARSPAVEGK